MIRFIQDARASREGRPQLGENRLKYLITVGKQKPSVVQHNTLNSSVLRRETREIALLEQ